MCVCVCEWQPDAGAGGYGGVGGGAVLGGEIGNDGLNEAQRLVKAIFESPECVQSEAGLHIQEVRDGGRQNPSSFFPPSTSCLSL